MLRGGASCTASARKGAGAMVALVGVRVSRSTAVVQVAEAADAHGAPDPHTPHRPQRGAQSG